MVCILSCRSPQQSFQSVDKNQMESKDWLHCWCTVAVYTSWLMKTLCFIKLITYIWLGYTKRCWKILWNDWDDLCNSTSCYHIALASCVRIVYYVTYLHVKQYWIEPCRHGNREDQDCCNQYYINQHCNKAT